MEIYRKAFCYWQCLFCCATDSGKGGKQSYNFTRALEEAQQGNTQNALEFLNKEVAENPKNGYAYMAIAALNANDLKYGETRSAIESALKYIPKKDKENRAKLYALRGNILAVECDTTAAYADLAEAIRLDPTNKDAYENRGQLLYEQHRYAESDADYAKILELDPAGVTGRMGLGRNASANKDFDKAIEQYNRIISLYPEYSSGYSFRAEAYLAKKDYLKAIDDICKALEIDSDSKAYVLMMNEFPSEQTPLVIAKLKALSAKIPTLENMNIMPRKSIMTNGCLPRRTKLLRKPIP